MGRCCDGLQLLLHLTVLALSGGLLGLGLTELYAGLAPLAGHRYWRQAMGTALVGAAAVLVWKLATCSVVRRSWVLLAISATLLATLFVVVEAGIMTGHFGSDDPIVDEIAAAMRKSIDDYRDDPLVEDAWDFVQRKLHCCGAFNGSDWGPQLGPGHVPASCCLSTTNCSVTTGAYSRGCALLVGDYVSQHRVLSVAVASAAAGLLLLALIAGWRCGFCKPRGGHPYGRLAV